MILKESL